MTLLSLKCRIYGGMNHTPCSGTTDDGTERRCECRCHAKQAERPSFTCPRCGMTSRHPDDVRERYCGNCHDWTGA